MTHTTNQKDPQGRPHGLWTYYHSDGHLWSRSHWLHGTPHGLWEWYRPNGTPYSKRYHLLIR